MTESYIFRHDFSNLHSLGPRKILPNEWEKHIVIFFFFKVTIQRAREYNWCWGRAGVPSAAALGLWGNDQATVRQIPGVPAGSRQVRLCLQHHPNHGSLPDLTRCLITSQWDVQSHSSEALPCTHTSADFHGWKGWPMPCRGENVGRFG